MTLKDFMEQTKFIKQTYCSFNQAIKYYITDRLFLVEEDYGGQCWLTIFQAYKEMPKAWEPQKKSIHSFNSEGVQNLFDFIKKIQEIEGGNMKVENSRHIITSKGHTQNGNSKFHVLTVTKEDGEPKLEPFHYTSWHNFNQNVVFKDYPNRRIKHSWALSIVATESEIIEELKKHYGEGTEIYRV